VIFRINNDGQIELLGVRPGKPGVTVCTPLHRRTHAVAVPQINVIPHPDLVPIIDNR
jgi:hypothetical protein